MPFGSGTTREEDGRGRGLEGVAQGGEALCSFHKGRFVASAGWKLRLQSQQAESSTVLEPASMSLTCFGYTMVLVVLAYVPNEEWR